MALIDCPECGQQVSNKAHACPNCGCPLKGSSENDVEFRAWRRRVFVRIAILCGISFPIGLFFIFTGNPQPGIYVASLSLIGLIVASVKLKMM